MIRSYALVFAAVTLRIELPLLAAAFGAFLPGYQAVAALLGAERGVGRVVPEAHRARAATELRALAAV